MAATNIHEFVLGIGRFADEAEDVRRNITKAVALRALSGVVLGTRVDTGRARGNWQVGEGAPPEGHDFDLGAVEGRVSGRLPVPSRREDPIARGAQEIGGASGADIIWLHNGVPYINVLEGWDKMVAGNVAALETWLASQ